MLVVVSCVRRARPLIIYNYSNNIIKNKHYREGDAVFVVAATGDESAGG